MSEFRSAWKVISLTVLVGNQDCICITPYFEVTAKVLGVMIVGLVLEKN